MQSEKLRPLPQKTIGVLGGMSNQVTGEYYRLINKQLNESARIRTRIAESRER